MNASPFRVALRADASILSGQGHVRRCAALAAQLLAAGAEVMLLTRDLGLLDGAIAAFPSGVITRGLPSPAAGARVHDEVPLAGWAGVAWDRDAADTVGALEGWRADWVVVDHYAFDARWHEYVRGATTARIAAIDDLADRTMSCDLLIDHNLHDDHRRKYAGKLTRDCPIFGGPRYALLGPAYARRAPHQAKSAVASVGIFMGGVDALDLSRAALLACRRELEFHGRIEIVATSSFPHLAALESLAREWPDTVVLKDLPELAGYFAQHDVQIGAGGGAMWERCCMGAPTLAVLAAENQRAVLPALAQLGAVVTPAPLTATDEEAIAEALRPLLTDASLRESLSVRAQALVDGFGARRVALHMARSTVSLRTATEGDSTRMYAWRNHPSTRAVSSNDAVISQEEHSQWLRRSLAEPRRSLYMAYIGSIDVGVIRFDRLDDGWSEVSLYLDPVLHGLGLGPEMLLRGEREELARDSSLRGVAATVLSDNATSQRLFASCGYQLSQGLWRKSLGNI